MSLSISQFWLGDAGITTHQAGNAWHTHVDVLLLCAVPMSQCWIHTLFPASLISACDYRTLGLYLEIHRFPVSYFVPSRGFSFCLTFFKCFNPLSSPRPSQENGVSAPKAEEDRRQAQPGQHLLDSPKTSGWDQSWSGLHLPLPGFPVGERRYEDEFLMCWQSSLSERNALQWALNISQNLTCVHRWICIPESL